MLFRTSSFAKNARPGDMAANFFLHDVDIHFILEFEISSEKYHPVFPKTPERDFWDTLYKYHLKYCFPSNI